MPGSGGPGAGGGEGGGASYLAATLGVALLLLGALPFAVILGALRPSLVEAGAAEGRERPFACVLAGLGACLAAVILLVALSALPAPVQGIASAPLLAGLAWVALLGWCGEARLVGAAMAGRAGDPALPLAGPTALGAAAMAGLPLLPLFGHLAALFLLVRGVGARVRLLLRGR